MDILIHTYNNTVYHCGPTRTGTTVAWAIFKDVVKFTNVNIDSINTGHKDIRDSNAFGKIITIRNPLNIAASIKRIHPEYDLKDEPGCLALCREVWNICNYIRSVTNNVDCKFICVVKYEDYFPNNIKQLVFDYFNLINKFAIAQHAEREHITMDSPEYSTLKVKNCLDPSKILQEEARPFILVDSYNIPPVYDDFNILSKFSSVCCLL